MATAIIPPHNQFHLCLGTFFAVWDYITSSVVFFLHAPESSDLACLINQ